MKRIFSTVLTFAIFVWILPLGSFIKPSQEKTACGGGRAFHMCSMGSSKARPDSGSTKISFSNASSVDKTQRAASGSSGNDFTSVSIPVQAAIPDVLLDELLFILPEQSFIFIPDPIPRF